jgi:hypothetical protein
VGNKTGSAARRIAAVGGVGAGAIRDDRAAGSDDSVAVGRRGGAETDAAELDATVTRETETAVAR